MNYVTLRFSRETTHLDHPRFSENVMEIQVAVCL